MVKPTLLVLAAGMGSRYGANLMKSFNEKTNIDTLQNLVVDIVI